VTNGESDFESRGFTDGYEADYISVQCIGPHDDSFPICTGPSAHDDGFIVRDKPDSSQTEAPA
jgi:hypothetical protein